ncbi:MAG: DUF2490 domain-containing protein [Acidobacteriota bacterium]|nr:DUF2490 domain-containing protein [Acidobacteriota bacterium]
MLIVAVKCFLRMVFVVLPLLFTCPVLPQDSSEEPRSDNQARGEIDVAVPLVKDLFFTVAGDLRVAETAENRFVRGEVGFLYKQQIGKYLIIVPRYRYRAEQLFNGTSSTENRLSADGIVNFKIQKFEITDNNLFEFRFRRSGNSQRYRNRLKISHPVRIGETKIDLFASDEVYYEWDERAWTRNRFKVGFGKDLGERGGYEIYYMRQNDGFSRPGDLHVFGIEFEFETKKLFGKGK